MSIDLIKENVFMQKKKKNELEADYILQKIRQTQNMQMIEQFLQIHLPKPNTCGKSGANSRRL